MNKIEHEEEQKKLDEIHKKEQISFTRARRGFMVAAILGAIVGIKHVINHENEIKIYDLNMQYSHMKPNFDAFILDFRTYSRFPRSIDTLNSRILYVPTGR